MKKIIVILLLLVSWCLQLSAQRTPQTVDAGVGIGSSEGTFSLSFVNNWVLGSKSKLELGVGGRLTNYLGKNKYYLTAPAIITSGQRGPQVFFIENIEENIDSVLFETAQVNSINVSFNSGYNLTEKLFLAFNIDLIGFSFGASRSGRYFEGNTGEVTTAKPTAFNVLLISDNDIGSLNSELFARYKLSNSLGIKAGLQFLFTEYTTESQVQQLPQANDRFRNKSAMFTAGVSYFLN